MALVAAEEVGVKADAVAIKLMVVTMLLVMVMALQFLRLENCYRGFQANADRGFPDANKH